jgi:hypothetical protein
MLTRLLREQHASDEKNQHGRVLAEHPPPVVVLFIGGSRRRGREPSAAR